MNLISCDNCGAVLDKDKIYFQDIWNYEGTEIDMDKAAYIDGKYYAMVKCPVCKQGEITNK